MSAWRGEGGRDILDGWQAQELGLLFQSGGSGKFFSLPPSDEQSPKYPSSVAGGRGRRMAAWMSEAEDCELPSPGSCAGRGGRRGLSTDGATSVAPPTLRLEMELSFDSRSHSVSTPESPPATSIPVQWLQRTQAG